MLLYLYVNVSRDMRVRKRLLSALRLKQRCRQSIEMLFGYKGYYLADGFIYRESISFSEVYVELFLTIAF